MRLYTFHGERLVEDVVLVHERCEVVELGLIVLGVVRQHLQSARSYLSLYAQLPALLLSQDRQESRLARSRWAHDGQSVAGAAVAVDVFEDGFVFDAG